MGIDSRDEPGLHRPRVLPRENFAEGESCAQFCATLAQFRCSFAPELKYGAFDMETLAPDVPGSAEGATQAADSRRRSMIRALGEIPMFQGLSVRHLEILAAAALVSRFPAGKLIFHQGDPANRFFIIQRGQVNLIAEDFPDPCPFAVLRAGEVMGWSWLFPPHKWNFSARTVLPTDAIFFYGARLRQACADDHEFGFELMRRASAVVVQRLNSCRTDLIHARRQARSHIQVSNPVESNEYCI